MNEEMFNNLADMLDNSSNNNTFNNSTNKNININSNNTNYNHNGGNDNNTSNNNFEDNFQNIFSNFTVNSNNNSNNSSSTSDSNSGFDFSNIDMATIMKIKNIMSKMNSKKDDPKSNLLTSLKPYLRDSKKEKLDKYMKMMNLTSVMEVFNNIGGDSIK